MREGWALCVLVCCLHCRRWTKPTSRGSSAPTERGRGGSSPDSCASQSVELSTALSRIEPSLFFVHIVLLGTLLLLLSTTPHFLPASLSSWYNPSASGDPQSVSCCSGLGCRACKAGPDSASRSSGRRLSISLRLLLWSSTSRPRSDSGQLDSGSHPTSASRPRRLRR